MSRANKRMREGLLLCGLMLGSGFLGLSRGTAQESGSTRTPVPVRPLTVRRAPPAEADPLLSGATDSDLAKMKKEIAVLQAEIAALKAAARSTPLAEPVRQENVLIQRRIDPPANATFQAGRGFTFRVEKEPGQKEDLFLFGMNSLGTADPLVETTQAIPAEEPLSAKKLEAIHEGFKNLPPSVRQKVMEALQGAGSQPVRIHLATAPAVPTPTFQAKPVQPSGFYHLHATPVAASAPAQAGATPPAALPAPGVLPSVFPPAAMPQPVALPLAPVAPAAPIPVPPPAPAPNREIEQKLNKILEKLEKLEKRLEAQDAAQASIFVPAPAIKEPAAAQASIFVPAPAIKEPAAAKANSLPVIYPANPAGNR